MIVDSDYLTLAQASRLAVLQTSGALYRAAQSGRLTTVTTMVGPRIVRLTTQAWLHAYLDGQAARHREQGQATRSVHPAECVHGTVADPEPVE